MDFICIFQYVNNGVDWQKEEVEKCINEVFFCFQKQYLICFFIMKYGYFKCDGVYGCCSVIVSFFCYFRMIDVLF